MQPWRPGWAGHRAGRRRAEIVGRHRAPEGTVRTLRRGSAINDPFGRKWLRYAAGTSLLFGLIPWLIVHWTSM